MAVAPPATHFKQRPQQMQMQQSLQPMRSQQHHFSATSGSAGFSSYANEFIPGVKAHNISAPYRSGAAVKLFLSDLIPHGGGGQDIVADVDFSDGDICARATRAFQCIISGLSHACIGLEDDSILHKSTVKKKKGGVRVSLQSKAMLDSNFLSTMSDEAIQTAVHGISTAAVGGKAIALPKKLDGTVRFMSANVGTLLPKHQCEDPSSLQRAVVLQRYFSEYEVDYVGVQEPRQKGDLSFTSELYHVRTSSCNEAGSYGAQNWVIDNCDFRVTSEFPVSSRINCISSVIFNAVTVGNISAHAPTRDSDICVKDDFWNLLSKTIYQVIKSEKCSAIILNIDANGRVGSNTSLSVGNDFAADEDDNGRRLRCLLEEHSLTATNTVSGGNNTWTSPDGHQARIDYTCISTWLIPFSSNSYTISDFELSPTDKRDHVPVVVDVDFRAAISKCVDLQTIDECSKSAAKSASNRLRLDKALLQDPVKRELYEGELSKLKDRVVAKHDMSVPAGIDSALGEWNDEVAVITKAIFSPSLVGKPRKPWISAWSWSIIRNIAPIRRIIFSYRKNMLRSYLVIVFDAWHNNTRLRFSIGCDRTRSSPSKLCVMQVKSYLAIARWQRNISLLQKASKWTLRNDKLCRLENLAMQAASAADDNDMAESNRVIRVLGGLPPKVAASIYDEDGNILNDRTAILDRWNRHFSNVSNGTVRPLETNAVGHEAIVPPLEKFACPIEQVEVQVQKLATGKGVGPDEIPAEAIQAGGLPFIWFLHRVISAIFECGYVPVRWRGGRIAALFKGKGDPRNTDSFRGLLLSDHSVKVLTGILQCEVSGAYESFLHVEQFGGFAGRGTAFAAQCSWQFLQLCKSMTWSCAIIFVDLSKAFDYVIRELLFGFSQNYEGNRGDKVATLTRLGLSVKDAELAVDALESGPCFLEHLGVQSGVVDIIRSLHTDNWFRFQDSQEVVVSNRGGRQGCKLGGTVFNFIYSRALKCLRTKLRAAGCTMFLGPASECGAPWRRSSVPPSFVEVPGSTEFSESTFIDDEALYVAGQSPSRLDVKLYNVLICLCCVFRQFGFIINWAIGKTEMLIKYRGALSRDHKLRLINDAGTNSFKVPPFISPSGSISVVNKYKHVGSVITADLSPVEDARKNARSALAAFNPLSVKLFGSKHVPLHLKLYFACSLIFSRLFYQVEVWPSFPASAIQILNDVYMRVLRRILNTCRFGKCMSDYDVRYNLYMPSVESKLRQMRLSYVGRMCRSHPPTLLALMQSGPMSISSPGTCSSSPWTEQIVSDLRAMKSFYKSELDHLPDPITDSSPWSAFMCDNLGAWKMLVSSFFSYASEQPHHVQQMQHVQQQQTLTDHDNNTSIDSYAADGRGGNGSSVVCGVGYAHCFAAPVFQCSQCDVTCKNQNALNMHVRSVHGARNPIESLVATPLCPVCLGWYHTRIHLIKHLATASKSKHGLLACGQKFLARDPPPPPIPEKQLKVLREQDRDLRRAAYKAGPGKMPFAPPPLKAGEFVVKGTKAVIVHSNISRQSSNKRACNSKVIDIRPVKRIRGKTSIANLELSVSIVSTVSNIAVDSTVGGTIRLLSDGSGTAPKKPRTNRPS